MRDLLHHQQIKNQPLSVGFFSARSASAGAGVAVGAKDAQKRAATGLATGEGQSPQRFESSADGFQRSMFSLVFRERTGT